MVYICLLLYIDMFELSLCGMFVIFFFKQKTADEMRISDWSSDVCSSDLHQQREQCEQLLTVHGLAQHRPEPRAQHAGDSERRGATPLHVALAGMVVQADKCVGRNRKRAGSERYMWVAHPHPVDHEPPRENGAPATDKPEREAHNATGN